MIHFNEFTCVNSFVLHLLVWSRKLFGTILTTVRQFDIVQFGFCLYLNSKYMRLRKKYNVDPDSICYALGFPCFFF